jgi:DNA-binding transcriptional MerR regulator
MSDQYVQVRARDIRWHMLTWGSSGPSQRFVRHFFSLVCPFPLAADLLSSPAQRGLAGVGHACAAGNGALDPYVASCRIVGGVEEYLTAGRLAELGGVTVRTLHHYDEIGLVCPPARTAAGYRAYSAGDVERLREVLAYRRLGFGLREVADLVSDPSADAVAHLGRLRGLLLEQRDRTDAMVTAIDRELTARAKGMAVTPEEQLGMPGTRLYDAIGGAYPATRRTDPRIAAQVWDALGDARTVLNVGAGTGSYEPPDRDVTAVEPSAVMRALRPEGSAPCLAAAAESLPFEDQSFDAAMAFSTVPHWQDPVAGLREMRRVARRVVVFTYVIRGCDQASATEGDNAVLSGSLPVADVLSEARP